MPEKILSIFIDESGDFGPYEPHSPWYLVSMVFHDQSVDIGDNIAALNDHLRYLGYPEHAIHTGPLIRRESIYAHDLMEERKRLFNALFHFARRLDFRYVCVKAKKAECPDVIALTAKLSKKIANVIRMRQAYFDQFDQIIVYYDNGQVELTKILTSVLTTLFAHVEFRKVKPVDYKLFQVADLVCTLEMLSVKEETASLSKSEQEFFHSGRELHKNYLKAIWMKRL